MAFTDMSLSWGSFLNVNMFPALPGQRKLPEKQNRMRNVWNVCAIYYMIYDATAFILLLFLNWYSFSQVVEVKSKAEEAKGKAQAALDKATATKKNIERSNNDLRDLIKRIRDFLSRKWEV